MSLTVAKALSGGSEGLGEPQKDALLPVEGVPFATVLAEAQQVPLDTDGASAASEEAVAPDRALTGQQAIEQSPLGHGASEHLVSEHLVSEHLVSEHLVSEQAVAGGIGTAEGTDTERSRPGRMNASEEAMHPPTRTPADAPTDATTSIQQAAIRTLHGAPPEPALHTEGKSAKGGRADARTASGRSETHPASQPAPHAQGLTVLEAVPQGASGSRLTAQADSLASGPPEAGEERGGEALAQHTSSRARPSAAQASPGGGGGADHGAHQTPPEWEAPSLTDAQPADLIDVWAESIPDDLAFQADAAEGRTTGEIAASVTERSAMRRGISRLSPEQVVAWLRAGDRPGLQAVELPDGWSLLEMQLHEGDGAVQVKVRREADHMAVAVGFTDVHLRTVAAQQVDRLQAALESTYETQVDLSFMNDHSSHQQAPAQHGPQAPYGKGPGAPEMDHHAENIPPWAWRRGQHVWVG